MNVLHSAFIYLLCGHQSKTETYSWIDVAENRNSMCGMGQKSKIKIINQKQEL